VVTVVGQISEAPPDLLITTRGQNEVAIPYRDNRWTETLLAGDHVVRLPAPATCRFKDAVRFDLKDPDRLDLSAHATIIVPGDTATLPLVTWTAAGGSSDPKNPWPPPLVSQLDAEPLGDSAWLHGTLTTLRADVATDRSAPAVIVPPAPSPYRG
jgi:hypothetical protein